MTAKTEATFQKLRRLCWQVAEALDETDTGRFDYVMIRSAKKAGSAAVLMAFDIEDQTEVSDPLLEIIATGSDPVNELIARYQKIEAAYDNSCFEEDPRQIEGLRDAHTDVMAEVTASTLRATTKEGALVAIRQALAEEKQGNPGDRSLTIALLEMGLAFFDGMPVDNSVDNGENSV